MFMNRLKMKDLEEAGETPHWYILLELLNMIITKQMNHILRCKVCLRAAICQTSCTLFVYLHVCSSGHWYPCGYNIGNMYLIMLP